jgi:alanine transaminase
VAEAIARRDGHPCSPEEIYMTDGASPAVHYMMDLLIRDGRNDAVMVPIPQVTTSGQL